MSSDLDALFSCFDANDSNKNARSSSFSRNETEIGISSSRPKRKFDEDAESKKKLMYNPLQDPDINPAKLDPGVNVHTITKDEDCLHEVAVPPKHKFPNLVSLSDPPAKTFKFQLDSFQKKAILCVENKQSVLVSAHTSAGKTVVAEYAIALAIKNKQRVIYTTPIKALSNQKYREMLQEFKDVGIMTGDVTIDPMASCLIMTTEILRSMLLRGSEVTKEVGWVIFDEIHYMRDKQRGVVWEETLILLPDNVRYVFLSATIPNARQFAEWISHLHQQPCHVVYTEYRPTPLQHYLIPSNESDNMYIVIDEKSRIHKENFNRAVSKLQRTPIGKQSANNGINENKKMSLTSDQIKNISNVVQVLMKKNLAPLIIFNFTKTNCEICAKNLSRFNFNTVEEQKLVEEVFSNAIDILSESEKQLPQITSLLPLLKKGVAFHHSGLLPLMKETVEILFGEGLIKALFATETFAMGLNMPARTVVFTSIQKFDGQDARYITSGEYIQMSGRAGRRGLDTNGSVIMMVDEHISPDAIIQIMTGPAAPLNSAFHITYNMILNLMRQEEINPEYLIDKSFLIFQSNARLLDLRRKLKTKQKKFTSIHIADEDLVASYSKITSELETVHNEIKERLIQSERFSHFLTKGRFVKIKTEEYEYDWGIIMGVENSKNTEPVIKVLLHVQASDLDHATIPKPNFGKKKSRIRVFPIYYKYIHQLSTLESASTFKGKQKLQGKRFLKMLNHFKGMYPHGLPLLNPVTDMGIKCHILKALITRAQGLEKKLSENPLFVDNDDDLLKNYNRKEELGKEIMEILEEIKTLQSVVQMNDLEKRKNVLRKLGYCSEIDVITMKGRVACELSTVDELLISEMVFNGIFKDLTADYCVALLSGMICDEKFYINDLSYDRGLYQSVKLTKEIASVIGELALECKLITSKEDYAEDCFKAHLVEIVLAWCRGASFLDICKMTVIYEGSIIRYLRILEEVLKQTCRAATNVGNIDLENRFSEGIKLLKRGVVFAGSLYL